MPRELMRCRGSFLVSSFFGGGQTIDDGKRKGGMGMNGRMDCILGL
jgi:hypothetical protein